MTQHDQRPQRVVQISDCHLFASTDGRLLGLNTEDSLQLVLDCVAREHSHIDVILATGDLSQDGTQVAYQRFSRHLERLRAPSYWLQGNHDLTDPIVNVLGGRSHLSPCLIEQGPWRIIMLNSSVEHEVPGSFQPSELEFLRSALEQTRGCHTMVCLHHHPLPMDCAWLDTQVVSNAADFWAVMDDFDHVRALIWGHVHQESDRMRRGVRLMSVPSTCVQFKPNSHDFAIDDMSPGYRWFDLYPDGRIDTVVSRVEGVKFEVDFSVKGY
ncbi:MAG: 3',5'-cyclic-AMP phosphodiesterase [bacterium]|nr:3',5'-cyclic-AMP phosphodiesterase [bacterium]